MVYLYCPLCHLRVSMCELLKCIHAYDVEGAQGGCSDSCQWLSRINELKTVFSVSLPAGMSELHNLAWRYHRGECHASSDEEPHTVSAVQAKFQGVSRVLIETLVEMAG